MANLQVNPFELIQMIKQGQNPQQLILNILEQNMPSSPVSQNLINLAKEGNGAEIEKFARNIAAQRGVDYDQAFNAFRKNLGI